METIKLNNDIKVFYVRAASFPDGVMDAWQKLNALVPPGKDRRFYGVSHGGKNGSIIYMAAAEELFPGEGEKLGCETFLVKRGDYISETLTDWKKDMSIIGRTFQKILKDSRVDPEGFCLEIYINKKDVQCLVKINSKN